MIKKYSDTIDKIDEELSAKKNKDISDEKEKKSINESFDKLQESIYKEFFKNDFDKLEKIIIKHTAKIKDIEINNRFGNLDITKGDWEESVQIEMCIDYIKEYPFFPQMMSLEELKEYNFKNEDFGLRVTHLGNADHSDPIADIRPTIEKKEFMIESKDEAYKYFNELLKKNILD